MRACTNLFIATKTLLSQVVRVRLVIVVAVFVSACSTTPPVIQDGGPTKPVDVSHIPNAKPQPVVRTRAGNAKVYTVLGKTYRTLNSSKGYRERGVASWYGTKFHGNRTANGEVYDMYAMTAAHKTLPILSYVRVTHVGNGRSVVVKINDRGPFHGNRLIDLSYAAARKLGVDQTGTALVDVVDITPDSNNSASTVSAVALSQSAQSVNTSVTPSQVSFPQKLYLQLGAFREVAGASSLKSRLLAVLSAPVNIIEGKDRLHRVTLGPTANKQQILDWRRVLQANGLGLGYIVSQ